MFMKAKTWHVMWQTSFPERNCWPWQKPFSTGIHLEVDYFLCNTCRKFSAGANRTNVPTNEGDTGSWSLFQEWLLGLIQTTEEETGLILVTNYDFVIPGKDGKLYSRIYMDFKSARGSTKRVCFVVPQEVSVGDGEDSGAWYSLKNYILGGWKFSPK